uniref:Uncharacterized protein n=1 Tax=Chromera velia CCMP2878 TaxID=1169474 RepID=A0A0G4I2Z8_9ALVE|eukprot:Cvel_10509.t1-p1 / transcript=Cvel_10509.t1 / gene=Cvel_10509 / organism=Chromera_velia_CCMP2878 / gene_product=hypothetical protein / transcript_product=hypothetical protein / location=Cvel_scaffold635:67426-68769(-) / protein_length=448 / sequence_SO=supercontig / SO=protein_coding / is_pseudo=false
MKRGLPRSLVRWVLQHKWIVLFFTWWTAVLLGTLLMVRSQLRAATDKARHLEEKVEQILSCVSRREKALSKTQIRFKNPCVMESCPRHNPQYSAAEAAQAEGGGEFSFGYLKEERFPLASPLEDLTRIPPSLDFSWCKLSEIEVPDHELAAARSYVSSRKIVFVGIVHNGLKTGLPNIIFSLWNIGRMFADFGMVFYENDSVDGTDEWLRRLAAKFPHRVVVKTEKLTSGVGAKEKHFQAVKTQETIPVPWQCGYVRHNALATYRNSALDLFLSSPFRSFDLTVSVDWDLGEFPIRPEHFLTNFVPRAPADWNYICAAGYQGQLFQWRTPFGLYDTLAYRDAQRPWGCMDHPSGPSGFVRFHQDELPWEDLRPVGTDFFRPVLLCSSGQVMVKTADLLESGCRWGSDPETGETEWVEFGRCLREFVEKKGRTEQNLGFWMNPYWATRY